MNNYQYFDFSKENSEEYLDPFYKKDKIVIPEDTSSNNILINNNARMIECITAFKVLNSQGYSIDDESIITIVNEIINIIKTTPNINYSAFLQFFMVYNSTYGILKGMPEEQRFKFVYEMLIKYCNERHNMYLNHGYSNAILQVMSDNYSHKRNGKATIEKILDILQPYNLTRIKTIDLTDGENFYFLPDKGDSRLFEEFLIKYDLKMKSRKIEQKKLPDIVFNIKGQYYICELKTMKGSGGGQNKQIVEIAYFIKFAEKDTRFHYLSYLDGEYANLLFNSDKPKIKNQREDIVKALKKSKLNYFVNTAGFRKLIEDISSN